MVTFSSKINSIRFRRLIAMHKQKQPCRLRHTITVGLVVQNKIFGAMTKDLYSEICVHFGIDSVENLVASLRNRFNNRYGETDNNLCQLLC